MYVTLNAALLKRKTEKYDVCY